MEFIPTKCPVTKKFLEDVFNQRLHELPEKPTGFNAARIESINSRLNINGKGYMSDITLLTIQWLDVPQSLQLEYPRSVILKQPTMKRQLGPGPGEGLFTLESLVDHHNRECQAYAFFQLFSDDHKVPLVGCYHRQRMTCEDDGLLMLEDLSSVALSPSGSMTVDQAESAVRGLALVQSYGIRHAQLLNRFFVRLPDMRVNPYETMIDTSMDPRVLATLQPHFPKECAYLAKHLDFAVTIVKKHFACKTVPGSPPEVLCLGDFKMSNLLFGYSPDSGTFSADLKAMIDFQICHIGNFANDIGFLLAWAFPPDTRRSAEEHLLSRFYSDMKLYVPNYDEMWPYDSLIACYKISLTVNALIQLCSVYNAALRFEENGTAEARGLMNNRMKRVLALFEDGISLECGVSSLTLS